MKSFNLAVFLFTLIASNGFAKTNSPCSGVDRALTDKDKTKFAEPLGAQLKKDLKDIKSVEILQIFKLNKWRIIYVNTHVSDEPYLFYNDDPVTHPYLTYWSGAAMISEEDDIYKWVSEHAKGIPSKLAHCFAYHVTKDRDQ